MKHKYTIFIFATILALFFNVRVRAASDSVQTSQPLNVLASQFENPPMEYRPCVWWHWLGSNFTTQGITKDLEAMAESGIGGACIFNIASSVQESHSPMENLPFPEQTFRSPAYWNAMRHTMKESKRLGLTMGLHGTPGYATTGGPWIPEERGMKAIISSKTVVEGGKTVEIALPKPELPEFTGYDSRCLPNYKPHKASLYWDITVMAVPEKENVTVNDIVEINRFIDKNGNLKWEAPAGRWTIYRYGYAPTMAHPHPLPDDIIGRSWEVDKMSREDNVFHWTQLLAPLKEHIGEYFGNTFQYIWVDSYESGYQNWTKDFREQFRRLKNYDVLQWIALFQYRTGKVLEHKFNAWTNNKLQTDLPEFKQFLKDYDEVVNRLYMDNGFAVAKEMLHSYGLKLYWEPYGGPFSTSEGTAMADVAADEFWTGGNGRFSLNIPRAAKQFGKRIIGAEAFTGPPMLSKYTEDPAFLKPTADGGYVSGANKYWLHHWVHQPFDDKYQPGIGMGWWGTHFSRYQTWAKPGKAFFSYLVRCQMLLQQGGFVAFESKNVLHRTTPDAEIFFVINPSDYPLSQPVAFPVKNRIPELWDAARGTIRNTPHWKAQGDSIYVNLKLETDESVFVVFPKDKKPAYAKAKQPYIDVLNETSTAVEGAWNIRFNPKLSPAFSLEFPDLTDFSKHPDDNVKYFAGTADYEKTINIKAGALGKNKRIVLDLGELHDIAELTVNGKNAGVLWYPPYKADITQWLKTGDNKIVVHLTTNWANRLIGDEQYPADFEIGTDRGESGRAMKAFPDWFVKNQPRPTQERKTFTVWFYFDKNSPLYPAGLIGPVRLIQQNVKYGD